MQPTTSPYILVKRSGIHGTGVFAGKPIPEGTRVLEYVGERITKKEADRRYDRYHERALRTGNGAVYIFELNARHDIDGSVPWNTAKYINHSCDPNCETRIIRGRIWIIALRDIREGEELSYNYGYDAEEYEDHPCRCGTHKCVGYILDEEHWHLVRRHVSPSSPPDPI